MTTQKYNCLLLYAYYVIQHMATPKGKIAKLQQKDVSFYISWEFLNQDFSRQKFYNSRNVRFGQEILKFLKRRKFQL
jgi:hypothetical protein